MIMSKFPRPLWRFTLFPVAESFSEKIKQPTRLSEGDTKWIDVSYSLTQFRSF
jgi:hypothetical protein